VTTTERSKALVVRIGTRLCMVPLAHVIETMRPLPIDVVGDMPRFVVGLSVIRGAPVPVVDLSPALGGGEASVTSRFVSLRLGDRRVALAVNSVIGVRDIDHAALQEMPPLLAAGADLIDAIGTLDAQLLVVLRATRILEHPPEAREALG
jgi:purine-binding chemotaxis protein CheW